ncbi:unnamed protein product [Porites evermanni]|uniref:Uncharacterized protein n=1 Tax=Porites evermanni TaxID=104178 RepID=A0ABN8RLS1_9CNID|nr:unnamed protein product [Porites evermanni]
MNNFKLLVKYFDARWTGDILSSYLFVVVYSQSVWFSAASSAQRKLRKRFSRILVLAFHLVRLKNLPQDLVRRYIPSVEGSEACFSRMTKTIPNKVGTTLKVSEVDHYEKI